MKYVTCIVKAAPLRKEPSHRSEMISQLLPDDAAEVLENEKQFTRVKCLYDNYEGWVANNQVRSIEALSPVTAEVQLLNVENVRQTALKYLDTPYLWGGKSS